MRRALPFAALALLFLALPAHSGPLVYPTPPPPADGGGGGGIGGWRVAWDCAYSAIITTSLAVDGPYTLCSQVHTKGHSDLDATPMALTNGAGVVIVPVAATDYNAGGRTLPYLTIPISSIIPDADFSTPIRVTVYWSANNAAADYDQAVLAIQYGTSRPHHIFFNGHLTNIGLTARFDIMSGPVSQSVTDDPLHNVTQLTLPEGVWGLRSLWSVGTYSSGWPAQSAMTHLWGDATALIPSNLTYVTPMSEWKILLGAIRLNSPTALSVAAARIRVEYMAK